MLRFVAILLVLAVSALAFTAPVATRPARMTMFSGIKKTAAAKTSISASKSDYVPDGLTKEQYMTVLAEEEKKRAAKKKVFFKGKDTLSLTDWMNQEAKKGLSGKELNIKGHRMVKAKYDSFYTDSQSGVSW